MRMNQVIESNRLNLKEARKAIVSMIHKIKKAQSHFAPGTSQYTLAKNRLKALRLASKLIVESLNKLNK